MKLLFLVSKAENEKNIADVPLSGNCSKNYNSFIFFK